MANEAFMFFWIGLAVGLVLGIITVSILAAFSNANEGKEGKEHEKN